MENELSTRPIVAEELPKYRGYIVRHPAPPEFAINPAPGKWDELRYKYYPGYRNSEARKRAEDAQ
jgi:hypothetical protein